MNEPLVSIIVPVYKVEKYIENCLLSIMNQTYKNLEIILVDDGSPDMSGKICDVFANRDNRLVVIHKENGGVSSARNAGLSICTGDYVMFVDSDDWLELDAVQKLVHALQSTKSGACMFELFNEYSDYVTRTKVFQEFQIIREHEEILMLQLATLPYKNQDSADNMVFYGPYCKIFKACYAKSYYFNEKLKYGEDAIYNYQVLQEIDRVCCINEALYHYRKDNLESATGAFRKDRVEQSILRLVLTWKLVEKNWCSDVRFQKAFGEMFCNLVLYLINSLVSQSRLGMLEGWKQIKTLANDKQMKEIWKQIRRTSGSYRAIDYLFSGSILKVELLFLRLKLKH